MSLQSMKGGDMGPTNASIEERVKLATEVEDIRFRIHELERKGITAFTVDQRKLDNSLIELLPEIFG